MEDLNKINSKEIGEQEWMVENLNVNHFSNDVLIKEAKTDEQWEKAGKDGTPAWCYYNNDPKNGEKYGKLYNWYAVNDPQGLAPKGWHIPSDYEWNQLVDHLGGKNIACSKMKAESDWIEDDGNNDSGFTALPSGYRTCFVLKDSKNDKYPFNNIRYCSYWWTSTEYTISKVSTCLCWFISHNAITKSECYNKRDGFSVRCLKD
ncbi:MAG: fibrobacter succinogenes major paralogous domain-containing protein [Bacteroidota bacterium]